MAYNGQILFTFCSPYEQQLANEENQTVLKNVSQTVNELIILKADPSDSGYYYCLAQIDQLVIRSKKSNVEIPATQENASCDRPSKSPTGYIAALTVLSVVIVALLLSVVVYMYFKSRKKQTRENLLLTGTIYSTLHSPQ